MIEEFNTPNINKPELENSEEKFILSRSTTIAELVQQGLLIKKQQDILELKDEVTLWENVAYDPIKDEITEDVEKIDRLTKIAPEDLLKDLIKEANIRIELDGKSEEKLREENKKLGIKTPKWEDIENGIKINEAEEERRIVKGGEA
jgi:hypothetical protein